jgi:hypothetical protein
MSIDYIRSYYGVPAHPGGRVRYTGGRHPMDGTIDGAEGAHLMIRLDGQQHAMPYHPTWKIEYLPEEPTPGVLSLWVITENPSDYPGQFVAREWHIGQNINAPTPRCHVAGTLDEVRAKLPPFLTRLPPDPRDDRVIVETWI